MPYPCFITTPKPGLVLKKISNMARAAYPANKWRTTLQSLKKEMQDDQEWENALESIEATFTEFEDDAKGVDVKNLGAVIQHNKDVSEKLQALVDGTSDAGAAGTVLFMLFAAALADINDATWDTATLGGKKKWAVLRKKVGPAFVAYSFAILESVHLLYTEACAAKLRSNHKGGGLTRWFVMRQLMAGADEGEAKAADHGQRAIETTIRDVHHEWIATALTDADAWTENTFAHPGEDVTEDEDGGT